MQDWPRAIEVLEGFRANFPKSELQADVTRKLAVAYTEAGRSGAAAAEFERIANSPGETAEVQREALAQAAALYEKSGDAARTLSMWEAYVKRFPQPFEPAIEARQKIADLAGARGDARKRAATLNELIKADREAGGARTDRSRYLAAKGALELAAPARDAFNAIALTAPLKKSLESKRNAMQAALKAYGAANDYAIAEVSTAATFEMAELYRRLGQDLLKSERPKNLQGEELEQYDLLLEEQAYPFEEKAIEIHLVNAARPAQGVYDASVRASFDALAKLKPARFAKVEQGADFVTDPAAVAAPLAAPGTTDPATAPPPAAVPPAVNAAIAGRFQDAVALAERGDAAAAEAAFARLTDEAPTLAGPAVNLGIVRARAGRWAEAQAALEEAVKRNASSAVAYGQLGLVYRELGRFGDAEQAYRRALDLEPNSERVHRNLGVLLDLYLQQPVEALAHYETALSLRGGEDKQMSAWIAELKQRLGGQKTAQVQP
jgi:tetratricopeptide (TPR) repeat protein